MTATDLKQPLRLDDESPPALADGRLLEERLDPGGVGFFVGARTDR